MNRIGVMQGRLCPPVNGKIQAFPKNDWEKEFTRAEELGLDEIEFIFESEDYLKNPLYTDAGSRRIEDLVEKTGILVRYVCADYFMEKPFVRVPEEDRKKSIRILKTLIERCSLLGMTGIEIPLVDNSRLDTKEEKKTFISSLRECLAAAEEHNIRLELETSLSPTDFKSLLSEIDHPLVGANYDTGNSASLGYDPKEEMESYGKLIKNIHIKDRILRGGTVPLGEGDADFDSFFSNHAKLQYTGSYILQTARKADDLGAAKEYKTFLESYLKKYGNRP